MDVMGLYIHIPFCQSKCIYCDFNSYSGCDALYGPYQAALYQEMSLVQSHLVQEDTLPICRTLYVGGGTPTALPAADLAQVIENARQTFAIAPDAEITVEANPGTVDAATLRQLGDAGVNRLSLGVQSLDDRLLRMLGRIHTAAQAVQAVCDARAAGLDNVNLDLIFGLPGQTLDGWQKDVQCALGLSPQHLSMYALTVEGGTPLATSIDAGSLPPPDDDLAAEMYEWAETVLERAGYTHYEISNWALPGYACRHNRVYWRNEPYIGLGAGAHSWRQGVRWSNRYVPAGYIAALNEGQRPVESEEAIDRATEMGETMMMGLRLLREGVSFARFERRFGVAMAEVYGCEIEGLVARGLLEQHSDGIRLTQQGHLLGNQVFVEFLPPARD